jgi:hypothetical protein
MSDWKDKEKIARRAIEDQGFTVHDANVLFRENCPNIDLVVFGKSGASYVQVKSSTTPATKDGVLIDGSPWTEEQLFANSPIFNKHADRFQASLVVIVDTLATGETDFYVAAPKDLEPIAVEVGRVFMAKPKRNGERRKMFRKEVPRTLLAPWRKKWSLLGEAEKIPVG